MEKEVKIQAVDSLIEKWYHHNGKLSTGKEKRECGFPECFHETTSYCHKSSNRPSQMKIRIFSCRHAPELMLTLSPLLHSSACLLAVWSSAPTLSRPPALHGGIAAKLFQNTTHLMREEMSGRRITLPRFCARFIKSSSTRFGIL